MSRDADVIVVGAGNAGFCAAHAAAQRGARVLLLEKAPPEWLGGNSYFTAGAIRSVHHGLQDVLSLVEPIDASTVRATDLDPYGASEFRDDMHRVTEGRADPDLTDLLVTDSREALGWLRELGIRLRLMYDRQSYTVQGRHVFWGGLHIGALDGGQGLIADHRHAAQRAGIELRTGHAVTGLIQRDGGAVTGVRCRVGDRHIEIGAPAIVVAAGGFEADPRLRAAYLGPNWDVAKVRGTPHNTGEMLEAMLAGGALPYGHWSGCHSIAWDAGAPATGDRELTNRLSRQSYPLGLVVNRDGERFLDEGADFRNYTYARYGAEILRQPGAIAAQLFDARTAPLLRSLEYESPGVSRVEAETIAELADALSIDPRRLERTIVRFNEAVSDAPFDPSVKDGKRTHGISPPKSNWAVALSEPPFLGFPVTCGITFTFGGVRIDGHARVLDRSHRPIPGLHAAGELVGGLFFHNYPGGTGLMAGVVFGRRAGSAAAVLATGRASSDGTDRVKQQRPQRAKEESRQ
ncbi:MAG TPA: FAD-dependent tricarballylate dehydrogenase TcuA [Solirubrobacteraceae bacterium]|nr:FAD-dependent tricarballylate dehydrogenase TcuA [Solirubrobacteraceae bacterium]